VLSGSRWARLVAKSAIEKMAGPTASPEECTQRQRRLTKGPEEFPGSELIYQNEKLDCV
jgi:hypothetical protein